MTADERADHETHAAARTERSRRRLRFAAVGLVCATALAGLVLKIGVEPIVAAGHGLVALATQPAAVAGHHVAPAEPVRAPVHDALADLPADVRATLVDPHPTGSLRFRFQLSISPAEICRHLADAGLPNGGWTAIGDGPAHECMSDLVPVPGSKPVVRTIAEDPEAGGDVTLPPTPSTVFFTARGRSDRAIDVIRLKLNLEDASVDRSGRAFLLKILGDLARAIAWPVPDAITDAVTRHRRAVAEVGGIRAEVLPENGDIRRVNLVLMLGTPATRLPADRFVSEPPLPPDLMPKDDAAPAPRRAVPPPPQASAVQERPPPPPPLAPPVPPPKP